jgi:hypothetical protein
MISTSIFLNQLLFLGNINGEEILQPFFEKLHADELQE